MAAKASDAHKRRARRAAAAVSACVVAFAALFVGLVTVLDRMAPADEPEEIVIAEKAPTKTFYVLLIGSDTRKGTALYTGKATDHAQVDQHSDVMTLMRVAPKDYKISFLSIPRDTVMDEGGPKINSALLDNDPNEVVSAVARLTGIEADYYMMTTFSAFADLIDALGGIDVDVHMDVTVDDATTGSTITLRAGPGQHLNGAQALALARARHEYGDNQDVVRQSNVRAIEAAIIQRVLGYHSVEDVEKLLGVVENDVQTNMDLPTVGLEVVEFMNNADKVSMLGGSGPYEGGGIREGDGAWVIPADEATWKKVVKAFKKGKDPTTVVSLPEPEARPAEEAPSSESAASASASSAGASSASASSASASSASASSAGAASSGAASASSSSASAASGEAST